MKKEDYIPKKRELDIRNKDTSAKNEGIQKMMRVVEHYPKTITAGTHVIKITIGEDTYELLAVKLT